MKLPNFKILEISAEKELNSAGDGKLWFLITDVVVYDVSCL